MTATKSFQRERVRGAITIHNDRGLHARPSTELVKCASHFASHISLRSGRGVANAKSILGILTLCATKGTQLLVEAEGPDAEEAVSAIEQLSHQEFNVNY